MSIVGNIKQWNQRCSVSAARHVSRTKIGDDGDSETSGENRRLASLPSCRNRPSKKTGRSSLVINGLTVAANELNVDFLILYSLGNRLGIQLPQEEIQAR